MTSFLRVAELLLLGALWGGSFLFMRIAAPVLGPVWLIEMRLLLAGLFLLPIFLRLGLKRYLKNNLILLTIIGCFNFALPFLLFAFASLFLPAGFTSILNSTTPLFALLITSIWFQEKLSPEKITGFLLGFIGVIVLVSGRIIGSTDVFMPAILAGLSAALMYAIVAPYIKKYLSDVPPLAVSTISQLSGAILLLPLMPFTIPEANPTVVVILSVIGLALFSTTLAYLIYFRLLNNIGVTKTLTVTYLIPLFSMLWGAMILGESITISMLLGCGLILLGIAIANNLFTLLLHPDSNKIK